MEEEEKLLSHFINCHLGVKESADFLKPRSLNEINVNKDASKINPPNKQLFKDNENLNLSTTRRVETLLALTAPSKQRQAAARGTASSTVNGARL